MPALRKTTCLRNHNEYVVGLNGKKRCRGCAREAQARRMQDPILLERQREMSRDYYRNKYANDPGFREEEKLRSLLKDPMRIRIYY